MTDANVCPRCKWNGYKAPETWPLCSACLACAGAPPAKITATVVAEVAALASAEQYIHDLATKLAKVREWAYAQSWLSPGQRDALLALLDAKEA